MSYRYVALISYAHADIPVADWLHRALETYKVPRKLAASRNLPTHLKPIFIDREELNAAPSLGSRLHEALDSSANLVVLCSRASAASRWVAEEVDYFIRRHGREHVIPIIVEATKENVFPEPLLRDDTGQPIEPLAITLGTTRAERRRELTRIASNLLQIDYAELVDREQQRRLARLSYITAASVLGMSAAIALSLYALTQRNEARTQRDIARFESQTSEQISNLLIDMFSLTNPETESADEIRATTILQRGAANVDQQLKGRPDVKARLVTAISRAYYGIGLLNEGQELLSSVSDDAQLRPKTAAEVQIELGKIDWRNGRLDEAEERFQRAQQSLQSDEIEDPRLLGELYLNWGNTLVFRGDASGAEEKILQAERYFESAYSGLHINQSRAFSSLGNVYGMLLKSEEAFRYYQKAIDILQSLYGDRHIQTMRTQFNVGSLQQEIGQHVEAIKTFSEVLPRLTNVLGANHPDVATFTYVLGVSQIKANQPQQAQSNLESALSNISKSLDAESELVADIRAELSRSLALQGRVEEAKKLHELNRGIYAKHYAQPIAAAINRVHLAMLDGLAGETDKALSACDQALVPGQHWVELTGLQSFLQSDCRTYIALGKR